jgi:hypothetical protein
MPSCPRGRPGAVLTADVPFWPTFWPALVAGLVATLGGGAALLGLGYWLVDRRLHLKDRADRAAEEDQRAKLLREACLHIAHEELQSIAATLPVFNEAIAAGDVPYPPFDHNGWVLVSQAHVLATLRPRSAETLMSAYNRVRSANEQMREFADLTMGATGALVNTALASTADAQGELPPLAAKIHDAYNQRRADLQKGLVARFTDLRKHIDAAIDAIESELGTALEVPSARRRYVRSEPVHDLTQSD